MPTPPKISLNPIDEDKDHDSKTRIHNIQSLTSTNLSLKNVYSRKALYFPSHLRKLSALYSSLVSIQKFNKAKQLNNIYIKTKSCIEKMLRDSVSIIDFERLNTLCEINCKKVTILHEGKMTTTFCFMVCEEKVDHKIWEHIVDHYKCYLKENGIEETGNRFVKGFDLNKVPNISRKCLFSKKMLNDKEKYGNGDDFVAVFGDHNKDDVVEKEESMCFEITKNEANVDFKKNIGQEIGTEAKTTDLDSKSSYNQHSNRENVRYTNLNTNQHGEQEGITYIKTANIDPSANQHGKQKDITCGKSAVVDSTNDQTTQNATVTAKEKAKLRTQAIFNRIKLKETKRRAEFIRQSKELDHLLILKNKLDVLFQIAQKKSLKVSTIITKLDLSNGGQLLKSLTVKCNEYTLKKWDEDEYLVKNK